MDLYLYCVPPLLLNCLYQVESGYEYLLGVSILSLFSLDFETVPIMGYFLFYILFIKRKLKQFHEYQQNEQSHHIFTLSEQSHHIFTLNEQSHHIFTLNEQSHHIFTLNEQSHHIFTLNEQSHHIFTLNEQSHHIYHTTYLL